MSFYTYQKRTDGTCLIYRPGDLGPPIEVAGEAIARDYCKRMNTAARPKHRVSTFAALATLLTAGAFTLYLLNNPPPPPEVSRAVDEYRKADAEVLHQCERHQVGKRTCDQMRARLREIAL